MKLLPLLLSATLTSANTGILLPLYTYPTTPLGSLSPSWAATLSAISALPSLPFHIIINISSGGPYPTNPPPDFSDWAPLLNLLNKHPSTSLLGYVATGYGSVPTDDVKLAISQYAAWDMYEGKDVHLDGIFVDEVDTGREKMGYIEEAVRFARGKFSGGGKIILNPGLTVQKGSEKLLDIADSVVGIETCWTRTGEGGRCPKGGYTPFEVGMLDGLGRPERQSVLVHDCYEEWEPYRGVEVGKLEEMIRKVVGRGVHSFYLATMGWGDAVTGPANITVLARLAAEAQGL